MNSECKAYNAVPSYQNALLIHHIADSQIGQIDVCSLEYCIILVNNQGSISGVNTRMDVRFPARPGREGRKHIVC